MTLPPGVTALFGGAFDPPHLGHREAALGLLGSPGIQDVWILPTPGLRGKSEHTPIAHRFRMAELTFRPSQIDPHSRHDLFSRIKVQNIELQIYERDQKPTTTFKTLVELKIPAPRVAVVIGADQLPQLDTWDRFPDVLRMAHWVVLKRKPPAQGASEAIQDPIRLGLEKLGSMLGQPLNDHTWQLHSPEGNRHPHYLTIIETAAPALSSTEIRRALTLQGAPPPHSLTPEVEAYLKNNRLYGTGSRL